MTYQVLHQFTGTDGSTPNGRLILDSAGNINGTTQGGGANGLGTAFAMNPAGQLNVLHNFSGGLDGLGPRPVLPETPPATFMVQPSRTNCPRKSRETCLRSNRRLAGRTKNLGAH